MSFTDRKKDSISGVFPVRAVLLYAFLLGINWVLDYE